MSKRIEGGDNAILSKSVAGIPPWLTFSAPIVSTATLSIVVFLYAIAFASTLDHSKTLDGVLFIFGALIVGPLCAFVQTYLIRPNFKSDVSNAAEAINCWTSVFVLLGLSAVSFASWVFHGSGDHWATWSRWVIYIGLALHILALYGQPAMDGGSFRADLRRQLAGLRARLPISNALSVSRAVQVTTFLVVYPLAALTLFTVDLTYPYFNGFARLFFAPKFADNEWELLAALIVSGLVVIGSLLIANLEGKLSQHRRAMLRFLQTFVLVISVALIFVVYFDYSLLLEPIHYLTNAGPALQVLHGRVPMVEAFSQYGPGPLMVTVMAYSIWPHTLGTAALATQLINLSFCALWLMCLVRMTPWKIAALLLGFAAIGCLLASWAYGDGNINIAPSILGLRYIPTLGMVLAISYLRPQSRCSVFTAIFMALSAVWSIECLINTLCVHMGFIAFLNLRHRTFRQMAIDLSMATLPAVIAIALASAAVRIYWGAWPDYKTYLSVLAVYNPVSGYWSEIVNPMFLAWMSMLLAVCLVLADASIRIFDRALCVTALDDVALYYRFLPMAMLVIALSAYFAFRSADYVLLIAFLPFCALAIPAVLHFGHTLKTERVRYKILLLPPAFIAISALAFTGLALSQSGGPYTLFLQECRDYGRCSASALEQILHQNLRRRHVLEEMGVRFSDQYREKYPANLIPDAVMAIEKYAPTEDRVTVLLGGNIQHDSIASDLALMYAGKGNRWPISLVFTDELIPQLAERIIAAPVKLRPGEIVVVRNDESTLGRIEAGILQRIRKEAILCRMPQFSSVIVVYRVAGATGCAKGLPLNAKSPA